MQNKKLLLLNILINCISASSALQILSMYVEYTFFFLNFQIIVLCNSCINCQSDIFPPLPKNLFTGVAEPIYKPLKQDLFDTQHIEDF